MAWSRAHGTSASRNLKAERARRTGPTRRTWVTLTLSLLLALGGLSVAAPKAAATTTVRVPLAAGSQASGPFAVFGEKAVLALSRSTDSGVTWNSAFGIPLNPSYVGEGVLVGIWGMAVDVYTVATDSAVRYPLPGSGFIESVNATTALVNTGAGRIAYDFATATPTTVVTPDFSGYDVGSASLTPGGMVAWWTETRTVPQHNMVAIATTLSGTPGPWVDLSASGKLYSPTTTMTQLVYNLADTNGLRVCTRELSAPTTESCTPLATGDYTAQGGGLLLSFGTTWVIAVQDANGLFSDVYRWAGGAGVKVTIPAGSTVAMPWVLNSRYGDTPYLMIRDANTVPTVLKVNADGSLSPGFTLPPGGKAIPKRLAVTPNSVVGMDDRDASTRNQVWTRPVSGSGFGAETMLSKRASWFAASDARTVLWGKDGDSAYDNRVFQSLLPPTMTSPHLSGPYLMQAAEPYSANQSVAIDVHGGALGTYPQGDGYLFGLSWIQSTDPEITHLPIVLTETIVASGVVLHYPLPNTADCQTGGVWGDQVVLNCANGSRIDVYNYRTAGLVASTAATSAKILGFGDGYVILRNTAAIVPGAYVWDVKGNTQISLPDTHIVEVGTDGVGHIAYSTLTELVWHDLSNLSTSPARALGWIASPQFDANAGTPAKIEIDATKALAAGSLEVKDAAGTVVRTIATPAAPNGSLRLTWDGKSDAGQTVPSGAYQLILVANGTDDTGPIKSTDGAVAAQQAMTVVGLLPGAFMPLTPARLMDTRSGVGGAAGAIAPNQSVGLQVAGQGGVPASGASAVVLNVTVVGPTKPGNITVYPSGLAVPNASNLNFVAGQTVPNLVTVKLGADGKVKLANQSAGDTHVIVDVSGYYVAGTPTQPGAFAALAPSRLLDTRFGPGPVGAVAPHGAVTLKVTGTGGIPSSGVAAVVLNVTETAPTQPGNITVYPSDVSVPTASNLNFVAGDTRPNLVTVKVSADGKVTFANQSAGSTHLIADVAGYYVAGTATLPGMFVPVTPTRLLDSRYGPGPVGAVAPQASVALQITGNTPVPSSGVGAVVLNVTETGPTQAGNITVYPAGFTVPLASNLNFVKGDTYPNSVIVKVAPVVGFPESDGKVKLANQSAGYTYLLADVAGYFLG